MFETELQKALRSGQTPEQLKATLGINMVEHPTLHLVAFKYDQIESPKTNPIVIASRGTVLEKGTWNLVAQPFFRFFNYGEHAELTNTFDFSNFAAMHKEDGSLAIVYYYNGEWHMNTSGSFAFGECNFSGKTWRELFWETAKLDTSVMDENHTYIFELCTMFNKVVRMYSKPTVFLLGVTDIRTGKEFGVDAVKDIAEGLGVTPITTQECHSFKDVENFLSKMESDDPTFEGMVLRDVNGLRVKIKTKTYLALHHLADNGNIANPKNIIPFLLKGEMDEILVYFPEMKEQVAAVDALLKEEFDKLQSLWQAVKSIEVQKDFALAIKDKTKFTGMLFTIRKTGEDLEQHWRNSAETIHKFLYK
jgi:hypothetical protein